MTGVIASVLVASIELMVLCVRITRVYLQVHRVYRPAQPHIEPWPSSLWQMPVSEQSFLLLDLMASLYAWPVLSPPLAVFPCWLKAWLAVVMLSRGMMFPNGPMSG